MSEHVADAIRQLRRASSMRALYPEGHPIYASSAEKAREAVAMLLGDQDQVSLAFVGGAVSCEGEPVEGEDDVTCDLADRWWSQGICGLTLQRGLTDGELDILLEMSAAGAQDLDIKGIQDRLQAIGGSHLLPTQTDYERFVPESRVPEELGGELSASDMGSVLRDLIAGTLGPGGEVDAESREALCVLLDHPQALASAVELGVLGMSLSGEAVRSDEPADLVVVADRDEAASSRGAEGVRLAVAVGRLAEIGCGADPQRLQEVCAKLADAFRHLDPAVVALAFRAGLETRDGGVDVLTEIARYLTVDELVEVVRAQPGAIAGEASVVYRRLLRRLSGGGERAAELTAALKEALLEDGMSEDVFASTVGMALAAEAEAPASEESDEGMPNVLPVAVRRASEEERAARRAEIEPELERAFGEAVWADRAVVSLELLTLADSPHLQAAAAADTRLALRRTPQELKPDVWIHAALELGRLMQPDECASEAQQGAARTVISETADVDLITALLDFLPVAGVDEHPPLFRALAASGDVGRAVLAGLLVERDAALVEEDVARITDVLLESEEGGHGGGSELSLALMNPDCWARAQGLRLVGERGTEASEGVIRRIVRDADQRMRWDTVRLLGQTPGRSLQALEIALEDPDDYIACAAATHLGLSGDPRAAASLIRRLRTAQDTEDRFPLRLTLVQALGELPCAEATEALAEALHTRTFFDRRNNDALRTAAAEGLMRFGTPAALGHLALHADRERCGRIRELAARAARTGAAQSEGRSETDAA
ncbi:MAG: HEAT repeat domain-containing protein [Armatimonadetes bacterium]|nr:HEAT repeat domain-containing protein [Armatimonadota bacterium]